MTVRAFVTALVAGAACFAGIAAIAGIAGCRDRTADKQNAGSLRIVSVSPSTTETIFTIGAASALVGRSRYCDWPPEVLKLPQVGGYVDPSLEAILALRPTLVTGARGPAGAALTDKLAARGIATYFPETESFVQIDEMILGLGTRTGHADEARANVDKMHARVRTIEAAVATVPRKRVLLVFGLEPLSVAGPKSFADEMLRHAGATNVVSEGGAYPTLGVERVLALDPDVIVNAAIAESHGKARIDESAPGWSRVRAVAEGHVVAISDESVLRPGPRVAVGLSALAHAVHPEVTIAEASP